LADQKPQYGSPEDFAKAIADLETSFSTDAVSTDADVLRAHGFSNNHYLPGTPLI
jgi:D-lactate dehydrogenase (cytochrome)